MRYCSPSPATLTVPMPCFDLRQRFVVAMQKRAILGAQT
jgi:hypothetical protein